MASSPDQIPGQEYEYVPQSRFLGGRPVSCSNPGWGELLSDLVLRHSLPELSGGRQLGQRWRGGDVAHRGKQDKARYSFAA